MGQAAVEPPPIWKAATRGSTGRLDRPVSVAMLGRGRPATTGQGHFERTLPLVLRRPSGDTVADFHATPRHDRQEEPFLFALFGQIEQPGAVDAMFVKVEAIAEAGLNVVGPRSRRTPDRALGLDGTSP